MVSQVAHDSHDIVVTIEVAWFHRLLDSHDMVTIAWLQVA